MGTRHQPHSARSCVLVLRAVEASRGCPGRAPLAWVWGVQGRALSHPRPLVLSGVRPGPTTHWLWVRGVGRGDPSPTPQRALLRAGFARCGGGMRVPGEGASCLAVGCPGSGALQPPTTRPSGVRPGPTTHWLWLRGMPAWGPVTNLTARALASWLCTLWGRHEGARGGGASCLGVGHPGSGALQPPTTRPFGRAAGAHYPLAVGAGDAGVETRHQPHNARSCVLALRAVGAARGRPGGAPLACLLSVRGRALSHPRPLVLSGMRPGPASHWPWVRCAGVGARLSLAPSPVPRFVVCCARFPGLRHPVAVVAWHLSSRRGCGRRRASLACLLAPRWCAAPRPVRLLSVLRSVFPSPWFLPPARGLSPPALLGGCAGHVEAGRELGCLCLPLDPAGQGHWARSASYPFGAPRWGCPWRVPPASVLGCVRCGGLVCVDPVTDASGFPYRQSFDGGLGRCTGAVSCGRRHLPFRVGGRHARVPRVCACACFLGRVGRARLPGAFWCASPFFVAVPGARFVRSAPSGLGSPCLWISLLTSPSAPPLSPAFPVFRPWVPWALASCAPPPPSLGVFFSSSCAHPLSPAFRGFRPWVSWALASCAPPSLSWFFFVFFLFSRAVVCRLCGAAVLGCCLSWALGRVGACCCGPCASPGACVRLRSVARCPLPVPPPFVLLPVVLRMPRGVVLAALLSPCCLWRLPVMPPPAARRLWCPLLCFVVPRAVWLRGLWCVLCCARWYVGCLCRVGFLRRVVWRGVVPGRVVLFLSCFPAPRCCVLCWFWAPGWFRVVSVSVFCLWGAVLVCLRCCSLCGALLPLRRWLVFRVVACCVCVFAVWPGCPQLSLGGSWWLLVSCFGGVLWCVPGCCAAPCCCALCRLALCCCALCCFVLLRLVLPCAVLCPGAPSVVLLSCAFSRRVLSCPPALCVFCCGVSLRGVVRRCALCRVRPGVSCFALPVISALCGVAVWPALPRCPAPLCCAPWCCAAAWCCGVLPCCLVVVLWRPALLPCRVCFLRLRGFTYLKNRCKIC